MGNGNDVVIGGSGTDSIAAGNGNDYLLGDNGVVDFVVVREYFMVLRATRRTWSITATTPLAGNGVDSIIGGNGSDTITTGDGDDIVLGDNGEIVQAFGANGLPMLTSDGTLHRDVVLERSAPSPERSARQRGRRGLRRPPASAVRTDPARRRASSPTGRSSSRKARALGDGSARWWRSQATATTPSRSATATDVVFGQGGNNTITAGNGNDMIFGDSGASTTSYVTDLPRSSMASSSSVRRK